MVKIGLINLVMVFMVLNGFGQEAHSTEHTEREERETKFRIAAALGHGYIPQASTSDANFVVVPTLGLDFQYWFGHRWGISLKSDIEISYYVVDGEDEDEGISRDFPLIISVPVLFRPFDNELEFILGPGIELEKEENFSIFRIGAGYGFEFGHHWSFAPEVIYDLKNGNINSLTLAISIGKDF